MSLHQIQRKDEGNVDISEAFIRMVLSLSIKELKTELSAINESSIYLSSNERQSKIFFIRSRLAELTNIESKKGINKIVQYTSDSINKVIYVNFRN